MSTALGYEALKVIELDYFNAYVKFHKTYLYI